MPRVFHGRLPPPATVAEYRSARALCAPLQCKPGHRRCWVEHGPVAMDTRGRCLACGSCPLLPGRTHARMLDRIAAAGAPGAR